MSSDSSHPLLSVGLITDLHYAPITVGTRCCRESLAKLRAGMALLQAHSLDMVVCLGDLIDKSETVAGDRHCLHEVVHTLSSWRPDTRYVLGNHDVNDLTKDAVFAACGASSSYGSFDCRGVHVVILDSNFNRDGVAFAPGNFLWHDAWIGDAQIRWLKADLAAAGGAPVLVFCHANLDDRIGEDGGLNNHIVRDAAAVRAVLAASGGVRAVVQGHDHAGYHARVNGIPYIVLRAVVEGAGLENNACAILSLYPDGAVVVQGFGRQPSLRFEGAAAAQT